MMQTSAFTFPDNDSFGCISPMLSNQKLLFVYELIFIFLPLSFIFCQNVVISNHYFMIRCLLHLMFYLLFLSSCMFYFNNIIQRLDYCHFFIVSFLVHLLS